MAPLPALEETLSTSTLCILRIVLGVLLGLLTVYRREMSCNREYHPDDEGAVNDSRLEADRERGQQCTPRRERMNNGAVKLRTRASSSSSLPTLTSTQTTNSQSKDPTEELLESASLFLSGGPFLAVLLAVVDHLILTVFLTMASLASIIVGWRRKDSESEVAQSNYSVRQRNDDMQNANNSVHHVAWNAATEYFTSISSKLEDNTKQFTSITQSTKPPTRSKSASNISQLSSSQYSSLLKLTRGHLDIGLLPTDAQICIFGYLTPQDLLGYTCTSTKGRRMLDDGLSLDSYNNKSISTSGEDDGTIGRHSASEKDTAILIWKTLFQRDFAWILHEWSVGRQALERSLQICRQDGLLDSDNSTQISIATIANSTRSANNKVLQHLLSTVGEHNPLPNNLTISNLTSMKEFYLTFHETWLNYTIAGHNTTTSCLIGLHGHVFDISNFVEQHPGSTETLLLQSGRDATVFFETMGHSLGARRLALGMCVVVNGGCLRWNSVDRGGMEYGLDSRQNSTCGYISECGLIRPTHSALQARRLMPGFVIPRKRSKPRRVGGLHRIRTRLDRELNAELIKAARWGNATLGPGGLFGGVQVYYDPICCRWRWWYTDLNFEAVYTESVQ